MKESELILTHILSCERCDLYLKRFSWDEGKLSRLNFILNRRKEHYPLAYLLGEIEFMGFNFKVSEGVFIPRQETEIVVEVVINIVHSQKFIVHRILDIGTGVGCIAISLAKLLPNVELTAIDISKEAIETAKENARLHNVKVKFLVSDLFENSELQTTNYELIVSNPPYIPTNQIEFLPLEVQFEPRLSLDGGWDGLDFYRRIIKDSPKFLKKDGFLILEMGFGQCKKIGEIFHNSGDFRIIDIVKDYSNIDRVIVAQLK
jgi:release factor glutamine methyltransferase